MIKIVIADDQHLIRRALRLLIESRGSVEVIGEASDGEEALQLTRQMHPDVLVMDINMPNLDGIEATRRIVDERLPTRVLILSMYSDEFTIRKALRSGARGYILKGAVPEDLLTAILKIHQDETYISPLVEESARLAQLPRQPNTPGEDEPDLLLTTREREVCRLIAEGMTNQEIANRLFISIKTVEKHRMNLMKKLDVHDTATLVRRAVQYKLIFVER